jgi:hypothetical protein
MTRIEELSQQIDSLVNERCQLMEQLNENLSEIFISILPEQDWSFNDFCYIEIFCKDESLTSEHRKIFRDVYNQVFQIPGTESALHERTSYEEGEEYASKGWALSFEDANELVAFVSKHQLKVRSSQKLIDDRRAFLEKELQSCTDLEKIVIKID